MPFLAVTTAGLIIQTIWYAWFITWFAVYAPSEASVSPAGTAVALFSPTLAGALSATPLFMVHPPTAALYLTAFLIHSAGYEFTLKSDILDDNNHNQV